MQHRIVCFLLASTASLAAAEVKVPTFFGDHMVLQRDRAVPVWGTAAPGERVTVEFAPAADAGQAGQKKTATADATGKWMVRLDPLKAGDKPAELKVGPRVLRDILVGEVWLACGQSNMEMPVGDVYRPDAYPGVMNFKQELAAADQPAIRLLLVEHAAAFAPASDVPTPGWQVCTPHAAARISAVGYFFARHLHEERKVPVGIISSAWSATIAETWAGASGLRTVPKFAALLDKREPLWKQSGAQPRREEPTHLYNGMIAPLIPMAIRGAIFYQGESNARAAKDYQDLFPALIRGWRQDWGQGDFPFLFVQLAAYGGKPKGPSEDGWANLREAQTMALSLPSTGMAVTIDIGHPKLIHPPNKQEVGRRLGLCARALAYGEKIEYSGPLYKSMAVEGGKIRLRFDHARGLTVKGAKLTGFAIAGADKKFAWADATIDGNEVVVGSPQVEKPLSVRYGWAGNPDCNLYNGAGLPASPFRTDGGSAADGKP